VRELGRGLVICIYFVGCLDNAMITPVASIIAGIVVWVCLWGLLSADVIPPTTRERFGLSSMGSLISLTTNKLLIVSFFNY
ncbi:hypothetical protein KJ656_16860, partial [bacterium]|nr:hypothetical protein [bacterium]